MLKITSVEPQKKSASRRTKRFNVFLDGQFAFGADEDLVIDQRLVVGKVIDKALLDKLLFEAEVGKLMEGMYRLFSIRQRSEKEIRNYFKIKNQISKIKNGTQISEMAIELVVEKLKQKGLINDLEFAKRWVEARRKTRQKGIRALKSELFQKGIARDIVEEVLGQPFDYSSTSLTAGAQGEEELARKALEKKMRVWKNLPPLEFKKKAYDFLMRRGFEYDVVRNIVEKVAEKE